MSEEIVKVVSNDGKIEMILTASRIIIRMTEKESARLEEKINFYRDKDAAFFKKIFSKSVFFIFDFFMKKNGIYTFKDVSLDKVEDIVYENRSLKFKPNTYRKNFEWNYNFDDPETNYHLNFNLQDKDIFPEEEMLIFIEKFNRIKPLYDKYVKEVDENK